MTPVYDSTFDTQAHIIQVRHLLFRAITNLLDRSLKHDGSKLDEPEKAIFDEYTPKLKETIYGSQEYWGFLREMQPALDHHYANNSHHPEHFPNGIQDMTLLDLVEMLCDWKAATMRHEGGDLLESIGINVKRFNISPELYTILSSTAKELGWL